MVLLPRPQFGLKSLILTHRQDATFILKKKKRSRVQSSNLPIVTSTLADALWWKAGYGFSPGQPFPPHPPLREFTLGAAPPRPLPQPSVTHEKRSECSLRKALGRGWPSRRAVDSVKPIVLFPGLHLQGGGPRAAGGVRVAPG